MTPQDLSRIHTAAFTHSRPWTANEFADLLNNRFTYTVGNEQSFALFQVIGDEAELLTIATHPDYQRQGLAQKIMAEWHAKARRLGAARAFLEVASDNDPAIAVYETSGYTRCGVRAGYYQRENGRTVDAIAMECLLNDK